MIEIGEARWLYFTEEWIEGRNLQDMIHEGRLSPDQVARLGVDLVMATDWLSNADLVIEATDGTDTRYIAMEVSFTADRGTPSPDASGCFSQFSCCRGPSLGVAAPAGLPVLLGAAEAARLVRDGGSPACDTEPEGLGLLPFRLGVAEFVFLALLPLSFWCEDD